MRSIYHAIDEKMFTARDMEKFKHFPGTLTEYVESQMLWRDEIMPYVILNSCAVVTNAKYSDCLTDTRKREVVFARYMAMYLLGVLQPALSLREIGELIGGKDHSTVSHANKIVDSVIKQEHVDQYKRWYVKCKRRVMSIYKNHDSKAVQKAKEESRAIIDNKEEVAT